jgi:hypothetical protein
MLPPSTERYDNACEKSASARPPALTRSTSPQHSLVSRPTCGSDLDDDAEERAWISRSPVTWSHDGLRSLLPPERINHTSLLPYRGRPRRVSALTGRLITASPFTGLHHGCCWSEEGSGRGRLLRCDKAHGENAASSARDRWSRLKIVTEVVGVIESSVPEVL